MPSVLITQFIAGLKHSPLLRSQLPPARRLALIETLQHCKDTHDENNTNEADQEALDIILYNVRTSPYLSKEDFQSVVLEVLQSPASSSLLTTEVSNAMANMMLDGNWQGLLSVASPSSSVPTTLSGGDTSIDAAHQLQESNDSEMRLRDFRDMVIQLLSSSARIAAMDIERRRQIGSAIHAAQSMDEIKITVLHFLDTSTIIETAHRGVIRDLIDRGRFDLLLLPEHLDCDEKPREQSPNGYYGGDEEEGLISNYAEEIIEEECAICLGEMGTNQVLVSGCNHRFCAECIYSWLAMSPTCPTCRAHINYQHLEVQDRSARVSVSDQGNGINRLLPGFPPDIIWNEIADIQHPCLRVYCYCIWIPATFITAAIVISYGGYFIFFYEYYYPGIPRFIASLLTVSAVVVMARFCGPRRFQPPTSVAGHIARSCLGCFMYGFNLCLVPMVAYAMMLTYAFVFCVILLMAVQWSKYG